MKGLYIVYVVAAVILISGQALAHDVPLMVKQLKGLQKAGVAIHKKYDFDDLDQVRACVAKNNHLRNEADVIRKKILDNTIDPRFRFNLILAADAAFVCVYCKDIRNQCAEVLVELAEVEKMLKER